MEFVHLHVHSHYSLLDGAARVPDLLKAAAAMGMKSLAITDHGNLFGGFDFYTSAHKAGVKPILGLEAYISPTTRDDRSMRGIDTAAYHLLLLATNETGWRNLVKLSSRAYMEGFYYRPRIDRELLGELNEGLVCCSACLKGEVASALLASNNAGARKAAGQYLDIFGKDRFFIEIMNHGYEEQTRVNPHLVSLAKELGVGLVGTNDVHFLRKEDKAAHEILTCVSTGKTLADENRMQYSPELYLKSADEMAAAFPEWPDALKNTMRIAEMVDLKLDFSAKHLPVFHAPGGKTPEAYLRELAWDGLNARFNGKPLETYRQRLEWELTVIEQKGYSSYFLIINDCVQFARKNCIPAAPRGSGVATLLGYALGFSDVDPLRYGLLFERFTDPQRQEDPDIDLDICQEGRAKIVQYVREKYGYVAQIITYGTLKARAAIKDVGRVMGLPLDMVNRITKLVPEGPKVTLKDALDGDQDLNNMYRTDPQIASLIDRSLSLEGLNRHVGVHAAGVVICDQPLDNLLPLYRQSDSPDAVTQWDGATCGKIGMMKMDFLGLRTLTIIQRARELVKAGTGVDIDPENIPLDDQRVFDLFRRGETDGVFQFEGEGMKSVLTQMKPNRLEDLIAANAMYRPGPMKLIPAYCSRKQGREPVPPIHPLVDELLSETYGIMVYQEQVMQVMNRLGKIPLNRALTGIKAISKKNEKVLMDERAPFIKGAGENGVTEEVSSRTFDLILEFAGYGFNKAHSTRYAIVAYQTAYFKTHYPREFVAATLTYECEDKDKFVRYMAEAQRMGVKIGPPDINTCDNDFTVDGEQVRFGLAAVKGVGERAVEGIVHARRSVGAFKDLHHFCLSVDLHTVNRVAIEALIKCGAFDRIGDSHRAALLAALDPAIQGAQRRAQEMKCGQITMFECGGDWGVNEPRLPDVPKWSREQTLAAEKETLGFYVSFHPLQEYLREFSDLNLPRGFTLAGVSSLADKSPVGCACIVSSIRQTVVKTGKQAGRKMAVAVVEDVSGGRCEAVLFSDVYDQYGSLLAEDALLYIIGAVQCREDRGGNIAVNKLLPLADAMASLTDSVAIKCPGCGVDDTLLQKLKEILGKYKGDCPVVIRIRPSDQSGETVTIKTERQWHVKPSKALVAELESVVEARNITLRPKKIEARSTAARFGWSGQTRAGRSGDGR